MQKLCAVLMMGLLSFASLANVAESVLTNNIRDRQPQDDLQGQFRVTSAGIDKVYFFTRVTDLAGKQIMHRWLFDDQVMAEVVLNVGGDDWRTYSSKRIVAAWSGDWKVEVLADGEVIHSYPFSVIVTD